jgi:hypothetical protein
MFRVILGQEALSGWGLFRSANMTLNPLLGINCEEITANSEVMPGKFYKRECQEKTPLPRLEFFYFRSPLV